MTPHQLREIAAALSTLPFPSQAERQEAPRRLAAVAASLLNSAGDPHSELVRALTESTGLTPAVVRWGLEATLAPLTEDTLRAFMEAHSSDTHPSRLLTLWLSSNLFAACVRPMFAALLCGVPVLVRLSSRESALASAIEEALSPVDRARLKTVLFDHRSDAHVQAALAHSETLEVYGSDPTVLRLEREYDRTRCRLIARGHGIGIALLGKDARETDYLALATDIAAYDQCGCLSPRIAFVEGDIGGHVRALATAMAAVESSLPRGVLPDQVASEQAQWRSLGAALGELHETPTFAMVLDHNAALPLGPTHRNLLIRPIANVDSLGQQLKPWAQHLKVAGAGGFAHPSIWSDIVQHVAPSARFCPLGEMQRPRFEDPADGFPPAAGLVMRTSGSAI